MDDISSGEIPLAPMPGEEIEEFSPPGKSASPRTGSTPRIDLENETEAEPEELAPPIPSAKAGFLPRIRDYEATPQPSPEPEPGKKKEKKEKKAKVRREEAPRAKSKPIDRGTEAPRTISEVRAKSSGTSRPRPKSGGDKDDPEKKGALIEQTPEQDTYEYRQRMRLVLGAGIVGVFLLIGLVIWRAASGGSKSSDDGASADSLAPPTIAKPPMTEIQSATNQEIQARLLLGDARDFARRKDVENATRILAGIVKEYPSTPTAKLAQEALDRPKRNLPLFVDGEAIVAEEKKAAPPAEILRPPEVVVIPPAGPPAGQSVVDLHPPPTPPEPFKQTGLAMEDAKVAPKVLPPGFRARPGVGVHGSGWPWEITCDLDGAAMVLVPGGELIQGSDRGPSNERPARKVPLGTFYIDQHEVTVGQYQLFLHAKSKKAPVDISAAASDLPMTRLTAREAVDYNQWAGKELPSEAQWEMAARTTDGRLHPWGNAPAEWIKKRENKQIDPVMSFPGDLSPYGVFDLAGNAFEWTNDWYIANTSAPPPKSKTKPTLVAIKGGSKEWLSAWRDGLPVMSRLPHMGFRGVLGVEPNPVNPNAPAAPQPGGNGAPGVIRQGGSPF